MWFFPAVGCTAGGSAGEDGPDGGAAAVDAAPPDGAAHLPPIEWTRLAGNGAIQVVDLSDDGTRVAFTSSATDLAEDDENGRPDAFVLDTASGAVYRASVSTSGAEADCTGGAAAAVGTGPCNYAVALSGDGRTAVFASSAPNLVAGDENGVFDLFARDLETAETTRINVASDGTESDYESWPSADISADGRMVAFYSLSYSFVADPGCAGVYLRDREAGSTTQVSLTWSGATDTGCEIWERGGVSISGDGATIAYAFRDGGIVPEAPSDLTSIFARDMAGARSQLVSASSSGEPADGFSDGPQVSADGRYVAFWSEAENLVPGDDNRAVDVFVHDRTTGAIERASVSSDAAESTDDCDELSISGDGRFVVFACEGSGLADGDADRRRDVFVRDRSTGTTALVSLPPAGGTSDGDSFRPVVSADGRAIAFSSEATNLHGGDPDGRADLFVAPNPLY